MHFHHERINIDIDGSHPSNLLITTNPDLRDEKLEEWKVAPWNEGSDGIWQDSFWIGGLEYFIVIVLIKCEQY